MPEGMSEGAIPEGVSEAVVPEGESAVHHRASGGVHDEVPMGVSGALESTAAASRTGRAESESESPVVVADEGQSEGEVTVGDDAHDDPAEPQDRAGAAAGSRAQQVAQQVDDEGLSEAESPERARNPSHGLPFTYSGFDVRSMD